MQSIGSQVHLESKFATYIQNEVRSILHIHTHRERERGMLVCYDSFSSDILLLISGVIIPCTLVSKMPHRLNNFLVPFRLSGTQVTSSL